MILNVRYYIRTRNGHEQGAATIARALAEVRRLTGAKRLTSCTGKRLCKYDWQPVPPNMGGFSERALVWPSVAKSENDDGKEAVAVIFRCERPVPVRVRNWE